MNLGVTTIYFRLFLALTISCFYTNCTSQKVTNKVPYQMEKPSRFANLAPSLQEISGLTIWNGNELAAIQDERGIIFILDSSTGVIKREFKFAKNGDFEDLAVVEDEVWVLRSDGVLFQISNLEKPEIEVVKYKTSLSAENDVEGLYFHVESNCLWLACKDSPNIGGGDKHKGHRAIYAFDLKKKELGKKPVITIPNKAIRTFQNEKYGDRNSEPFKPSAISVRPKDGFIYMVSSVGQTLLVLEPEGDIHDVIRIETRYGRQFESLTFDAQSGLYMASEGKMGKPTLLFYAPKF